MNMIKYIGRLAVIPIRLVEIPPFLIMVLIAGFWLGWVLGEKNGFRNAREIDLIRIANLVREGRLVVCDEEGNLVIDHRVGK